METSTDGAKRLPARERRRLVRSWRATGLSPAASVRSILQTTRRPRPARAAKTRPSFRAVNQSSMTCPMGRVAAGRPSRRRGVGAAHEIPPLPVAVEVRREIGEGRVARVAEKAERGRGLAAGPRGVPEDAGEAEGDLGGRQGRAEGVGGADGAVVEPDARLPVGAFEGEHEGFVRPGGGTVNSR